MNLLEVLETQGLSEKQISAITDVMYRNRIFITYEEKIEERYHKMKLQRDSLKRKIDLIEKAFHSQDEIEGK